MIDQNFDPISETINALMIPEPSLHASCTAKLTVLEDYL